MRETQDTERADRERDRHGERQTLREMRKRKG